MAPVPEPVVWIRCEDPDRLSGVAALTERLTLDGDHVRFLVTIRNGSEIYSPHPKGGREVRAFLAAHKPLIAVQIGGHIDSTVLSSCKAADIPLVTVDSRPDTLREMTGGWFRSQVKPTFSDVAAAFANDVRLAESLRKLGVPQDRIFAIGPLEPAPKILPFQEHKRAAFAQILRNRPVWMARAATLEDVPTLAVAHSHAARLSHRLMLCISPRVPMDGPALQSAFDNLGFNTALRSQGDDPEESVQVYVVDLDGEDGLWLRLSPICFSAGTLSHGALHDPFEAAALGSVMIHGLHTDPFEEQFRRLLRAGASLGITEPEKLGKSVAALLSADKTAEMALAGWTVTSAGAEISNRIVGMIQARLDQVGS